MHRALIVSLVVLAASCKTTDEVVRIESVATEADRASMTPDAALAELKAGNLRFVSSSPLPRNLKAQMESAAEGAFPFAAVLSTTDSRLPLPAAFDAGIGDIVCVRTHGCQANENAIAALEDAVAQGVKVVLVLDHSDGPHRGGGSVAVPTGLDIDGQGTETIEMPAAEPIEGIDPADIGAITYAQVVAEFLRTRSPAISAAAAEGRVQVVAAFYDIPSGAIVWL